MADAWVGKSSVTFIFWVPTQEGVEAVRIFFEGHANFMGIKSHQHGPLKLIHYYISEGPEWVKDEEFWEQQILNVPIAIFTVFIDILIL